MVEPQSNMLDVVLDRLPRTRLWLQCFHHLSNAARKDALWLARFWVVDLQHLR